MSRFAGGKETRREGKHGQRTIRNHIEREREREREREEFTHYRRILIDCSDM